MTSTKGIPRLTPRHPVGNSRPSSHNVLLDLAKTLDPKPLLRDDGIADVADLLNNDYPATRRPLDTDRVKSYALQVSTTRTLR